MRGGVKTGTPSLSSMNMKQYDIFISYSRTDIKLAEEIQQTLEKFGLRCFRDTSNIHVSEDWIDVLSDRIMDSKIFLLLGSSNAYRSKWTKREVLFADNNHRQIVPYMIDNAQLPPRLSFLLGNINQRSMSDYPIEQLVDELKGLIGITPVPSNSPQPQLPKSSSEQGVIVQGPSQPPFIKGKPFEFVVKGVKFNMMPVKAGKFVMGTTNRGNGFPAHEVQLLKDYYIGETEVTQSLWEAVMGNNPSHYKGALLPVETVSWDECHNFLKKLGELTRHHFRFPTEAEWEFAARGRKSNPEEMYAGSSEVWNVAWYSDNNINGTSPVKQKMKNELGIYDMSGNVNEWCQDFYANYPTGKLIDPLGPTTGTMRVARGGSWYENEAKCRVYVRNKALPSTRSSNLGLRLALSFGS